MGLREYVTRKTNATDFRRERSCENSFNSLFRLVVPDTNMESQAQEPGSIDTAPEGANEDTRPSPPRKKAARRSSLNDNGGRESAQKRRRRAFSCLSCQRLKCRCEYDPGAQGCHRCQTLRFISLPLRGPRSTAPFSRTYEIRVGWELTSIR